MLRPTTTLLLLGALLGGPAHAASPLPKVLKEDYRTIFRQLATGLDSLGARRQLGRSLHAAFRGLSLGTGGRLTAEAAGYLDRVAGRATWSDRVHVTDAIKAQLVDVVDPRGNLSRGTRELRLGRRHLQLLSDISNVLLYRVNLEGVDAPQALSQLNELNTVLRLQGYELAIKNTMRFNSYPWFSSTLYPLEQRAASGIDVLITRRQFNPTWRDGENASLVLVPSAVFRR
ncbi:MAG: hypothetical protein IT371_21855 [Deltaproteobacteria bacterium]|nr:hypothetical protein [Deltaproteobacteria bacterium]